jgi:hypothetical protein
MGNSCLSNKETITIKTDNEEFKLEVEINSTIGHVKKEINKVKNIPINNIYLSYNWESLADDERLDMIGFNPKGDCLTMTIENNQSE